MNEAKTNNVISLETLEQEMEKEIALFRKEADRLSSSGLLFGESKAQEIYYKVEIMEFFKRILMINLKEKVEKNE